MAGWQVCARERPPAFSGVSGITLESIERYLSFWPAADPVLFAEVLIRVDDAFRGPINEKASKSASSTGKGRK